MYPVKNKTFLSLSLLVGSFMSLSSVAYAHGVHEDSAEPKATPTACRHLTDTEHYVVDLKDPATQALKARCDATKKPVTPAAEKKAEALDKK
jgi:hypothetical protein